jgi:hypothetical protein
MDEAETVTTKRFDPAKYLTKVKGNDFLEVKYRLLWLRTEHPDAIIETQLVEVSDNRAIFKAKVTIPDGGVAIGWGSETAKDFSDFIEKGETKAIGRALRHLGYGTEFTNDEGEVERSGGPDGYAAPQQQSRPARRNDYY